MTGPSMTPLRAAPASAANQLTVLAIVSDRQWRDQLEAGLDDDDFDVRTTASSTPRSTCLDGVDCLVSEYPMATDDLLERVKERIPDLPVVFLVDESIASTTVIETVRAHQWIDYVRQQESDPPVEHLSHRIHTLIKRRRLEALSRRSLASVELASDAIAIAAPNDDLEFTNRSFAVQFGTDRDDLPGTPWQALFTDESVERLETAAIPTVADGWRWTGSCIGCRTSGETFPVKVRLGGLEDGSLVFAVDTP
ncbi:PAS domain-containing protein [Natronorubrum thiooxidans]|uniref:PAS domain-containing protein n=1 Tax=Natronorubrum thiooxidans TaxID=308853 RepID=A0A1N7EU53_9EURY|nr:PAS domain-containing protein [Natronorubrum thiooxidans]SIR91613.1 PAS domain-containing protein [Natronorubrum thiooxidans]